MVRAGPERGFDCNRLTSILLCGGLGTVVWSKHPQAEETMGRKFVDCRQIPSDVKCTLALVADTEDEVLEAAVLHAVTVHQHQDTPELREQLRGVIKDGSPSA
jgi:predicted small metal-binding protein